MGTNCVPLVADLFLFCYERVFMLSLFDNNQATVVEALNPTSKYQDYLFNNSYFKQMVKVSNGAKIRKRYNQVPHLTQDTNGKVTNSPKTPQTRDKRSALSQQVTTKHI